MGANLRKVGRTDRKSYVRVLLGEYREDIRQRMERLRSLRRARGEILYINQMMDADITDAVKELQYVWEKYREATGFKDLMDGE